MVIDCFEIQVFCKQVGWVVFAEDFVEAEALLCSCLLHPQQASFYVPNLTQSIPVYDTYSGVGIAPDLSFH